MDELADAIWGDRPPTTYKKVAQGCVVGLRRTLGEDAINTREAGYSLALPSDDVDAAHFEILVEAARSAVVEGDPRRAVDTRAPHWNLARRSASQAQRGPARSTIPGRSVAGTAAAGLCGVVATVMGGSPPSLGTWLTTRSPCMVAGVRLGSDCRACVPP